MPTYEYACSSCKNQWEEIQKISEPAQQVCPKCSQNTAQRQISGGRFILKGGGWYADLYSSSKPGTGSKKDEGGGGSDAKTDAKNDAKTDAKPGAKDSPATAASPKESGSPSPSTPPASKS